MYRPITLYRCVRRQMYREVLNKANRKQKKFLFVPCSLKDGMFHRKREDSGERLFGHDQDIKQSCKIVLYLDHAQTTSLHCLPFFCETYHPSKNREQRETFFVFYLLYSTLLYTFVAVHTDKALLVGTFY